MLDFLGKILESGRPGSGLKRKATADDFPTLHLGPVGFFINLSGSDIFCSIFSIIKNYIKIICGNKKSPHYQVSLLGDFFGSDIFIKQNNVLLILCKEEKLKSDIFKVYDKIYFIWKITI